MCTRRERTRSARSRRRMARRASRSTTRPARSCPCATTEVANHCWLSGLEPDTEYTYKVFVKGQEWASGERWDWSAKDSALVQSGGTYDNRFRTIPDATPRPRAFPSQSSVISGSACARTPRRAASSRSPMRCGGWSTGKREVPSDDRRQHLRARARFGVAIGGSGDEDDDWFFTYFQPYRYVINRIPVYPSIGNHDADETEGRDDRAQVEDNFYIHERIESEEAAGRASSPGPVLPIPIRLGHRIRLHRYVERAFFNGARLFEFPKHWEFIEQSFPRGGRTRRGGFHSRITRSKRRPAASQHALRCRSAAAVRASQRACHVCGPRA